MDTACGKLLCDFQGETDKRKSDRKAIWWVVKTGEETDKRKSGRKAIWWVFRQGRSGGFASKGKALV